MVHVPSNEFVEVYFNVTLTLPVEEDKVFIANNHLRIIIWDVWREICFGKEESESPIFFWYVAVHINREREYGTIMFFHLTKKTWN